MSVQIHHFRPWDSAEGERSEPGQNDVPYVLASDHERALQIERGKLEKADAENDRLTARVAELQAAVLKYGWHDDTCNFLLEAIDCDCGLEALRASLATGEKS